jgi:predicted RNA binding protein YcfA (HicA-like mRNA interferase family)
VLRALGKRGVSVVREGGGHTVLRSVAGRQSTLPRHTSLDRQSLDRHMVRGVVKQLGLEWDDVRKDLR